VVLAGSRVLRDFDDDAARTFSALAAAGVLDDLARRGAIIGWDAAAPADAREVGAVAPRAALVLEHPRIPFVSYPYEWPFAMLKAAALLTLEIQTTALAAGFTLKDASPYNVQFVGTRPLFIDLGSFDRYEDGAPWAAYTQFCRLFLYPLLLDALRGVPYHAVLRSSLDGIDAARLSRLLRARDKLRPSVFRDVVLQSWLERWAGTITDRETLAAGRVTRRVVLRLVDRLRDAVTRLRPGVAATHWSGYDETAEYSAEAREIKERTVEAAVTARSRSLVWDLGCNTGRFSLVAARGADHVVALDADAAVVNTLALAAPGGHTNLLPLVVDVLNPSPDQGWAGGERLALVRRGRPDLALCLGLLHHLVIRGQVPLHDVVDWLAGLAPEILVEFVPTDDPGFRKLVRWRTGEHHAYSAEALEAALGERFGSVTRTALAPSGRVLYRAAKT
jgi:ribosomal protein L11 methylase PrmA